jgi:hypothetical protein
MQKIDSDLQARLQAAREREPEREIPVIVTIVPGSDLDLLTQSGLVIERAFELISAVSGTTHAADVQRLAQLDVVVRVEYDGPVHAC